MFMYKYTYILSMKFFLKSGVTLLPPRAQNHLIKTSAAEMRSPFILVDQGGLRDSQNFAEIVVALSCTTRVENKSQFLKTSCT